MLIGVVLIEGAVFFLCGQIFSINLAPSLLYILSIFNSFAARFYK